jgi:hypothetical protein
LGQLTGTLYPLPCLFWLVDSLLTSSRGGGWIIFIAILIKPYLRLHGWVMNGWVMNGWVIRNRSIPFPFSFKLFNPFIISKPISVCLFVCLDFEFPVKSAFNSSGFKIVLHQISSIALSS